MSNKSDSIAKIALALSKLQGEVTDATKDKTAYNYKYADLAGVLEIARPLCLKYELAVTQLCCGGHADGEIAATQPGVGVTTILMHSSGEWVESNFIMPLSAVKGGNAAQAAGSIITYARRYALAAILGITQTDNDAAHGGPVETDDSQAKLKEYCMINGITKAVAEAWCAKYGVDRMGQLNKIQIDEIING